VAYLKSFKLDQVQWSGFSRLRLLEVEIDMFMGGVGLPAEPELSVINGDLERDVRDIFRRAMNREDVESPLHCISIVQGPEGTPSVLFFHGNDLPPYLLINYFTITACLPLSRYVKSYITP